MGEQEDNDDKLKNLDLLNSENSPINLDKAGEHLQNNINMLHNLFSHADTETQLATYRAWISIFIIFTFSFLTIRIVQKTRRDARIALESYYQDMSHYRDHECLKTRTLHVKGVLPDDRTGNGIEAHLNKILAQKSFNNRDPGKVRSVLIIPDFTKQLEIELKIQDLKDYRVLMTVLKPNCMQRCLIPSSFLKQRSYEKAMHKYEAQLIEETMKPFVNSGHAFICFDSVSSCNTVLRHFKPTTCRSIKIFMIGVKNSFFRFIRCFGRDTSSPGSPYGAKGRGNFLKHSEEQDLINIDYDRSNVILIANKASEPIDILWRNMGEIVSPFSFTRFFLFVLALLCVLFLSSPAVMLSKLQKVDPTSFFYFQWTENFGSAAPYLQKSMPTMILLLINVIVIQILDLTCVIESYDAHSKY